MAELKGVELVDLLDSETETEERTIILKEDFKWFLTEEFERLREGFKPTDNSEYIKDYCKKYNINTLKEKIPPCNTTESEPIVPIQGVEFSFKQLGEDNGIQK